MALAWRLSILAALLACAVVVCLAERDRRREAEAKAAMRTTSYEDRLDAMRYAMAAFGAAMGEQMVPAVRQVAKAFEGAGVAFAAASVSFRSLSEAWERGEAVVLPYTYSLGDGQVVVVVQEEEPDA